MDWNRVADTLESEAAQIRLTADSAFDGDYPAQREMRTRATLMVSFARAIRAGTAHQPSQPVIG